MLPSGLMRLQLPSFRNDAIKFAKLNNLKGLAEKPALNFSRYQFRGVIEFEIKTSRNHWRP